MESAHRRLVIALVVTVFAAAHRPRSVAQTQSHPVLRTKLQAGWDALGSRQWISAISLSKAATQEAQSSCAECYLGLAAAYSGNGQLQDAIDSCDHALQIATDDASKLQPTP